MKDDIVNFNGRLFSSLPLPVFTKLPLHINAFFSVSPDRGSIHEDNDSTVDPNSAIRRGALWNTLLFKEVVVPAWAQMLECLIQRTKNGLWVHWPTHAINHHPWSNIQAHLIHYIVEHDLPLWYSCSTKAYVRASECFVTDDKILAESISNACEEIELHIVCPDKRIHFSSVAFVFKEHDLKILSPSSVRSFLRGHPGLVMSARHRSQLLDFVTSDRKYYNDLDGIELLPLRDGTYTTFDAANQAIKMGLDDLELRLFPLEHKTAINLDAISQETVKRFRDDINFLEDLTIITRWSLEDAGKYCQSYYYTNLDRSKDIMRMPEGFTEFATHFWFWVEKKLDSTNYKTMSNLTKYGFIWLVPLQDVNVFRRLGSNVSCTTLLIPSFMSEVVALLAKIYNGNDERAPPFLQERTGVKDNHNVELLKRLNLLVDPQQDPFAFVEWLQHDDQLLISEKLDGKDRQIVLDMIHGLFKSFNKFKLQSSPEYQKCRSTLQKLKLFKLIIQSVHGIR